MPQDLESSAPGQRRKAMFLLLLDKGSNKQGFTADVRRAVEGLGEVRADLKSAETRWDSACLKRADHSCIPQNADKDLCACV